MSTYQPLLDQLYTQSDAHRCMDDIDVVVQNLFNTKYSVSEVLEKYMPYEQKQLVIQLWEKQGVSSRSAHSVEEWFEGLKKVVQKTPELRLEVGFDPSEQVVKSVVRWIERNMKEKVLISFVRKQGVVGGARVFYNGKYMDGAKVIR